MDLTPLYELRERLRAAAIAGTALIPEDFRLKRAIEQFAALESASPVFAKIGALVKTLVAPDCTSPGGILLEALGLLDAVLCTQATVPVTAPVEYIIPQGEDNVVVNAPYSVVSPLVEALTTSGAGRYSYVVETHTKNPALFSDYRIRGTLVKALGASYTDLAERAKEWLCEEGERALPLLLKGFDPRGKKEMVRRVEAIDAIAGGNANAFYLSSLESAVKEVRAALIYALRHREENAQILLDFAKKEKGDCKKKAHWALAQLDSPQVWEYWRKLASNDTKQAAEYMILSKANAASDLVADMLIKLIEPFEQTEPPKQITKETGYHLQNLLYSLLGKSGANVCTFYRRAAALGFALNVPGEDGQPFLLRSAETYQIALPFSLAIPLVLQNSLICNPSPDLLALASELFEADGSRFAPSALTAAFLTQPTDATYALAKPFFEREGIFRKGGGKHKATRKLLVTTLSMVIWDDSMGQQVLRLILCHPMTGAWLTMTQPLKEPMGLAWYRMLTDPKGCHTQDCDADKLLCGLVQRKNTAVCDYLGKYFYSRALTVDDPQKFFLPMQMCGWETCENIAVNFCLARKKEDPVPSWTLVDFLERMPGDPEARIKEIERVLIMVEEKKIKLRGGDVEEVRFQEHRIRIEASNRGNENA